MTAPGNDLRFRRLINPQNPGRTTSSTRPADGAGRASTRYDQQWIRTALDMLTRHVGLSGAEGQSDASSGLATWFTTPGSMARETR